MSDIKQTIYTLFVLMALIAAAMWSASEQPAEKTSTVLGKNSVKNRILLTVRS